MRKIDIEFMRRHIGALSQITQVAHVALIDHFVVVLNRDAVDFEGFRFIDQVKQCRERVAQADASAQP